MQARENLDSFLFLGLLIALAAHLLNALPLARAAPLSIGLLDGGELRVYKLAAYSNLPHLPPLLASGLHRRGLLHFSEEPCGRRWASPLCASP